MTLRLKLVLLVVFPLAVVFGALVWLQYGTMRRTAIAQAKEHALLLTQATARDIEGQLAKAVHVTHAGAVALEAAPELSGNRVWPLLKELVERVPLVDGASIARAPGYHGDGPDAPYVWKKNGEVHQEDLATVYDVSTRNWYTIAADGTAGWTKPYDGPGYGGLLVSYSVPVIRHERLAAVISVDVPLAPLQDLLTVGEFKRVMAYLVGPDDRFISHPDSSMLLKHADAGGGPSYLAQADPGTLIRVADWPNGRPHIVAFEPIPTADWMLAAAMPEDEVLGPVREQLSINVLLLAVGGIVIAGFVLVMGLRLTGDVRKLGSAVARVSAGDLGAAVAASTRRDELGVLVQDFNSMTAQLRDTVQRVADEQVARRAMEQELEVAREIQEEMLPHEYPMLPDCPSIDLHAINLAARHVAGDFYDYWTHGNVLTIVLADVSGSGMPAALVMVRAMTLLRQFDDPQKPLSSVVQATNAALCHQNDRQLFVTGVIIRFNMDTGRYHLVSAGHLPPLRSDGLGEIEEEGDSTGPLLGVIQEAEWSERTGDLASGGWLGLYTDGITEARNADGEMFEMKRLLSGLADVRSGTAQVLCEHGIRLAEAWHGGPVDDDLSMMVLRWTKQSPEAS